MHVMNQNLKNATLNIRGKDYQGDAYGVFEMPDKVAALVVGTPGWMKCRVTKETQKADRRLAKAQLAFHQAQSELDAAIAAAEKSRLEAAHGGGTEIGPGKPKKAEESEEDPTEPVEEDEEPEASEDDEGEDEEELEEEEDLEEDDEGEDEEEDDEDDEDGEEDTLESISNEMKAKGKGASPSVRWTSDALIRYCNVMGIDADSGWDKTTMLGEIEELSE